MPIDPNPDMENREITFTAASAEPYERVDWSTGKPYYERLVVTPDACNLDRLNGGASILKNHDPDRILGTITKAWIEDGKVVVRARFRKNDPDADAVFKDIVDGTLPNVSIGYEVEVSEPTVENGVEFRDVTRWMIFEVSVAVGVPADPTVGFYRSFNTKGRSMNGKRDKDAPKGEEDPKNLPPEGEDPEQGRDDDDPEAGNDPAPGEDPDNGGDPADGEDPSAGEDPEDGDDPEDPEDPEDGERDGDEPEDDAQRNRAAAAKLRKAAAAKDIRSLNINRGKNNMGNEKKYNIYRAVQSLVNRRAKADYEREVSDEMQMRLGMSDSDRGIMLSFREGEFINASNNGSGLVGTDHRGDLFVQMLRKRMGVKGATVLSGLVGNQEIPAQTAATEIGISALNATAGTTKPQVGSITLSPKKFSAAVTIGEDLIAQGNPDAINFVLNDLQAQLACALDLAILTGNVSPAITGVDGTTGVQTVTIANLASITWADVLKMYGKIADYEIEDGDLAWVTKGSQKAAMMGISKDAGSGRFLVEDGKMNGYDVNVCGSLASDALYLGVWRNVFIGQWGGLSLRVDDVTGIKEGSVTIVAKLLADIAVTNPQSFVKRVGAGS